MTINYERQNSLSLDLPLRVVIVGCGGVGSWAALFIAMAGVEELWLFDHDTLSESNLNRVLFTKEDVNKPKSQLVKELVMKYRPDCNVFAAGRFMPQIADSLDIGGCYVLCCTDTAASRKMCYDWSKSAGRRYVEAAAEGEVGSITGEPADFSTPDEHEPGYASVPVWVGPVVSAALMATAYITHDWVVGDQVFRQGFGESGYEFFDSLQQSATEDEDGIPGMSDEG